MKPFLTVLLSVVWLGLPFRSGAQPAPIAATAYATYLGGGGPGYTTDAGYAVTVGGDGSVYVLGQTSSEPFPHTAVIGGFDTGYGTFVTKLSPDGKTRVYSTFLSGLGGRALAVDGAGSVYLTGETGGVLPGTSSAQADFGGSYDAFVLKLSPDGQSVAYATYLGGHDLELGRGIAVDPEGNAYVVGWTTSTNFPATAGAAQTVIGGGFDAFVAKLNPDGTQFVYATYLGGTGFESGAAIALDSQRRAVVVGRTISTNFLGATGPTRFGSSVRSLDAYVARLGANGQSVDYLTVLGGDGYDAAARVVLAADGSPVVLGQTESAQFPATPGSLQPAYRGTRDLFVARLTPEGGALTFCTFLGTSGFETVGDSQYAGGFNVGDDHISDTSLLTETGGLALDADGNVLVSGTTGANDWPGAGALGAGGIEVVAAKLSAAGDRLLWLNFLGGLGDDYNYGLAADGQGGAWIAGEANRPFLPPYLPTSSGAVQPGFGGGVSDAFLIRLNDAPGLPVNDDFAARLPLTGSRLTTTGRSTGATKQNGEPNHAGNPGGASLWWSWTAPADGRLTLSTEGSDFDTLLAAYTGNAPGALTTVAGNDDAAPGMKTGKVKFTVVGGVTYQIAVDGKDGATGAVDLTLTFSQPPNDDFADRIVLTGFPVTATGANINATAEDRDDAGRAGVPGGQSVWWEWTSPTNGVVAISTSGSSFNTTLGVYTGPAPDALQEVKSNDNYLNQAGADQTSQVTFTATLGTRYLIAVDGYYSDSGTIQLSIFPGDPPRNDNFADRFPLTGFFAKVKASSINATTEAAAGEKLLTFTNGITGNVDLSSAGYSVWWTWTAPTNGRVKIFTSDITFDTRLGVFTGDTLDQLRFVAANDNQGGTPFDYSSHVSFPVVTGTAYQIEVDGNIYGGHSGGFTLNLLLERPPRIVPGTTVVNTTGGVQFQVQGLPGVTYQVERSTDLKTWTPGPAVTPDTEFFTVTDPVIPGEPWKFYRLVADE
jgi:hypothetical protein